MPQVIKITHVLSKILVHLLLLLSTIWVSFILWVHLPLGTIGKSFSIGLWWAVYVLLVLALISAPIAERLLARQLPVIAYALALVGVVIYWASLTPQQHRDWAADVARELQVEQQGNLVTLHNVRNFDWRTTTDFTPRWETRHYDISQLQSVDVINSYWMGAAIAHTLVSFGFDNGQYLTFSLETRREKSEQFSAINGFFRKYELSLIAADERDIVYTRSNVRGEKVYLYRVNVSKPTIQRLFTAYLNEARQLEHQPRFYNSLTSNCTTIIFHMAKLIEPHLPIDYRIILSGYLPQYMYEQQGLDQSVPFSELQQRAFINQFVLPQATPFKLGNKQNFLETPLLPSVIQQHADIDSATYSKVIRTGLRASPN